MPKIIERKWETDISVCIKRLYSFLEATEKWNRRGGGNMEIFNYLNMEGNTAINLPRHPYLDYNEEEKAVFEVAFGKPIQIPKALNISISMHDFLEIVKERRDLMRETIAFTKNSRFRNKQFKPQKGKEYKKGR